jgi:hypothetical protein
VDLGGWSLPLVSVDTLTGSVGDASSIVGKGAVQFHKSSRLRNTYRVPATSDLALPATGNIDWEITKGKIHLKALKDVYSDGKLLKFSLLKNHPMATIGLDGQLDVSLRVKPTRPLLKLTDKSILAIQGTLKEPRIVLQDDK